MTTMTTTPTTPTSPPEKEMIVKEPRDDDVLLGQGHYRHKGNKALNELVDAKVDEYKSQSRVFKTFMAHEIVNKIRSKGVRFLKELAPKGWIVVTDDKEAREKVAQRFQYMMRKQAADAKAKAKSKAPTTTTKPKKAAKPPPRLNFSWKGATVKIPFLPVFHQLQKSSVLVDDDVNDVSIRLQDCFDTVGIQDCFNAEEANAVLTASDDLKMRMNLWKPLGGNRGVIVELINVAGDTQKFHKYSRYVLEASTGLFDRYKHMLFQSGAKDSVQDHVSAFTATKTGGDDSRGKLPTPSNPKSGMTRVLSDRALQEGGKKKTPRPPGAECFEKKETHPCPLRRPTAKRTEPLKPQSMLWRDSKVGAAKESWIPKQSAKSLSTAPKIPFKQEPEGEARAGDFASTFSRWETGIDTSNTAANHAGQANARKPFSAGARRASTGNYNFSTGNYNGSTGNYNGHFHNSFSVEPDSGWSGSGLHPARQPSSQREEEHTPNTPMGAHTMKPLVASSPANDSAAMARAGSAVPNFVTSSVPSSQADGQHQAVGLTFPGDTHIQGSQQEAYQASGTRVVARHTAGSFEPLPFDQSDTNTSDRHANEEFRRVPAFDRWAATSSNHEMKCDSSIEEGKLDAEMASIDQTISSLRRLSLSSNDASLADPRTNRDHNFAGLWPLTNDEMKCDSSLDDEPYDLGHYSATQSFLPSSFFAAAPNARADTRTRNPPSPAHSFCSHISVEMRSIPSPVPSSSSHLSVGVFSVPSPCSSFNSRCSLGVNSLKHARMDEAPSPSMFESDQSAGNGKAALRGGNPLDDVVPPAIFVDSSSAIAGPPV